MQHHEEKLAARKARYEFHAEQACCLWFLYLRELAFALPVANKIMFADGKVISQDFAWNQEIIALVGNIEIDAFPL